MKVALRAALCAAAVLTWAGTGSADPATDESGEDRRLGGYAGHRYEDFLRARDAYERRRGEGAHAAGEVVEMPAGHLPPPGECRDWHPDRPAGHQPPPYRC